MKSIALLHTVKTVAVSFESSLREYLKEGVEEVKVHNLWDDFLANDPNERGEFTVNNKVRLFNDLKNAELTGADLIVVTCSTLTPHLKLLRPLLSVPVIAIDDELGKRAAECANRILVLASAGSTKEPMLEKLNEEADKLGKKVEIDFRDNPKAFDALKAADMDRHDRLLLEMAEEITGYDCVVLAQASMAHLEERIESICKIPTISSPKLCMEAVREALAGT